MQESVLAESTMMVPETRQRLESALSDLQTFLVRPNTGQERCPGSWFIVFRATSYRLQSFACIMCSLQCKQDNKLCMIIVSIQQLMLQQYIIYQLCQQSVAAVATLHFPPLWGNLSAVTMQSDQHCD
jgi:hypothetical protein